MPSVSWGRQKKRLLCQAHPSISLSIKRSNYCINCTQGTQTMIASLREQPWNQVQICLVSGQWPITHSERGVRVHLIVHFSHRAVHSGGCIYSQFRARNLCGWNGFAIESLQVIFHCQRSTTAGTLIKPYFYYIAKAAAADSHSCSVNLSASRIQSRMRCQYWFYIDAHIYRNAKNLIITTKSEVVSQQFRSKTPSSFFTDLRENFLKA